jgi:hypothetical protein
VFYLSFLYVAGIVSECFKIRSGVTHGICVGSWRGRAPAWPQDVGTGKQRSANAGPCVDVGKRTAAAGVHAMY